MYVDGSEATPGAWESGGMSARHVCLLHEQAHACGKPSHYLLDCVLMILPSLPPSLPVAQSVAESAAPSSDAAASAATATITVLAVVGAVVGGAATVKYFFF